MNFCILGAGAWGTAMAIHLRRAGNTVTLAPRRMEQALEISTTRENKAYLPNFSLDPSIQIGWKLKPILMEADAVLLATPSKGLREICQRVRHHLDSAAKLKLFVTLCKGLEKDTLKKPVEVLRDVLPGFIHGTLTGPTFANEVAGGKPAAMVFASDSAEAFTEAAQHAFSSSSLRVYTSSDLVGVELGSCLKNVYAIAAGICDGLNLGENAKATLLTRSLAEMVRLGIRLGGRTETFYGLSGCGDLLLTCNGKQSRNRAFGELIAQGVAIEELIEKRKITVEGYGSTDCFYHLCQNQGLDAPILNEVYAVLYEGKKPAASIIDLMTRQLKPETPHQS